MGTSYEISIEHAENLLDNFEALHMKENGFLLPGKPYRIEYLVIKYFKYPPNYSSSKP